MKSGKNTPAGRRSKGPTNANRSKLPSASPAAIPTSQHIDKLNGVHQELRAMVNDFLSKKSIPLKVHTMHFAEDVGDSNCCLIDGQIVCGPQCF
jgi:hypothetical protein